MTGDRQPLPFLAVVAIASLAAGLAGSAIYLGSNATLTFRTLIATTLGGGWPISLVLAGLAGPTLAKMIIGRAPLDWAGAALLGVAISVVPAVLILVTVVPIRVYAGEPMELRGWLGGLVALAVSGCVGGLAFRWLHGERPIG